MYSTQRLHKMDMNHRYHRKSSMIWKILFQTIPKSQTESMPKSHSPKVLQIKSKVIFYRTRSSRISLSTIWFHRHRIQNVLTVYQKLEGISYIKYYWTNLISVLFSCQISQTNNLHNSRSLRSSQNWKPTSSSENTCRDALVSKNSDRNSVNFSSKL